MYRVVALSAVLFGLFSVAPPARAAELPDLEQVAPYHVQVIQRGDRWFLGFATAVRNNGPGALLLRGDGVGDGSMTVRQLTPDGLQVLAADAGAFHYVTTYGHNHWHYMDFMKYELRGLDAPGVLRDRKQGFCLSQALGYVDTWCARDQATLTTVDLGLRVGGIDIYEPNAEGQEIEIDPDMTPSGRYLLTSRIGPTGVVQETRIDNNVASTMIELRWPLASGQQIAPLSSCLGEGCAGTPPTPRRLPKMTAAEARRLARRVLRRTFREPRSLRLRCRPRGRSARTCRASWLHARWSFSGNVRVRYGRKGAATRWYYRLNVARRGPGCQRVTCAKRIRHAERLGGTLASRATSARAAPLLCRLRG